MQYITYIIYDEAGNQVWRNDPIWNSVTKRIVTDETINLSKGTYYLAVPPSLRTTGKYYTDAVAWAVSREITNGTGNNLFSPDKTCNITICVIVYIHLYHRGSPAVLDAG